MENKFQPIAIKINSIEELKEINDLYDNQFDYLDQNLLPCYVTIEGFNNEDYSYFSEDCSNKNELLKNLKIVSIKKAKEMYVEIPNYIKEKNKKENEEINSLFSTLKYR